MPLTATQTMDVLIKRDHSENFLQSIKDYNSSHPHDIFKVSIADHKAIAEGIMYRLEAPRPEAFYYLGAYQCEHCPEIFRPA
jgi:hypothetical protein